MVIGFNLIAEHNEKGAGTTTYMRRLFKEMGNSYNLRPHKFIVYKQECISEKYWEIPDDLDVEYISIPNVGAGLKRVLFEQTFFYKYLKPCDVLFSNCTSLPLLARCKKIYTQHDVYFLHDKKSYGFIKRIYRKFIVGLYVKCCDKILTVSQYSKDQIVNAYGIPESKIEITYNFINTRQNTETIEINELKGHDGKKHTVPNNYFLYIGRLQHNKNVERMVLGFNKYVESNNIEDTKLIIVGEPAYKGDQVVDFLSKNKNVVYLGYADNITVKYLQRNCIAVVLTSLYEGFGIPIIEGFANNKVCITSETSSLPEVAGKAGILVDPYDIDSIARGFNDIILNRDTLKNYIPEQLEKFSPHKATEAFMNALGISFLKK